MPREKRPAPDPNQIIRDIPLIARYSRHNENADYSFRAYLKADSPLSNMQLDSLVGKLTDEVWAQIDCTTCANCCRSLEIEVTPADVDRLAKHLQITVREFHQKYVLKEEQGILIFNSPPCPFLGDDNLCTVYEARPDTCRDYPFLYRPNFRARTLSIIDRTSVCPIVFNVWQRLKNRLNFRRR